MDKRQFPRRVGLYPYRLHKGRKLVLGDRTETLVYILAHELRHMHQQHGSQYTSPLHRGPGQEQPWEIFRSRY